VASSGVTSPDTAEHILLDFHCWGKVIPFPSFLPFPSHPLRSRLPSPYLRSKLD